MWPYFGKSVKKMALNYLYINQDNVLTHIIPEFDPVFPSVPSEKRFSKAFLSACVKRTEEQIASEGIYAGMVYDPDSDTFSAPPEPV